MDYLGDCREIVINLLNFRDILSLLLVSKAMRDTVFYYYNGETLRYTGIIIPIKEYLQFRSISCCGIMFDDILTDDMIDYLISKCKGNKRTNTFMLDFNRMGNGRNLRSIFSHFLQYYTKECLTIGYVPVKVDLLEKMDLIIPQDYYREDLRLAILHFEVGIHTVTISDSYFDTHAIDRSLITINILSGNIKNIKWSINHVKLFTRFLRYLEELPKTVEHIIMTICDYDYIDAILESKLPIYYDLRCPSNVSLTNVSLTNVSKASNFGCTLAISVTREYLHKVQRYSSVLFPNINLCIGNVDVRLDKINIFPFIVE
jgi:hypothetical protein